MNWVGELCQHEINRNDTLLDLGCGIMQATMDTYKGYPPTKLQCKSILGVDIYEPYLNFLKERGVLVQKADLCKPLPFEDKSFDVVLLLDILEHLNFDEAVNLLGEAERVARKKVIVLTPRNFRANEEATQEVYPYTGLGENPFQQHKSLISPQLLRHHSFKTLFPSEHSSRYHYTFAVKKLFLSILHVWDQAGVAAVLSKHQRSIGQESYVLTNENYDGLGINKFYRNIRLNFKLRRCASFPRILVRIFRKINSLYISTQFYITASRYAKHFDILHIHSVALQVFFVPFKPKILEFHGDDIRLSPSLKKFRFKTFLYRIIAFFCKDVYISTPDLVKEIKKANLLPNPVDTEHFVSSNPKNLNGKALYIHNWYEGDVRAKWLSKSHGWQLTILDRANKQHINYEGMPSFLSQFSIFIDRHAIHSLSKTALESLAMGLKVVRWDGKIVEGLPKRHKPENVAKTTLEIYKNVLK